MTSDGSGSNKLRVIIVGGGVAALETGLALAQLAPEQTDVTFLAPNDEFVYRPMTVLEPFSCGGARRYPLARVVADAGAELIADELDWIERGRRTIHTRAGRQLEYDALVLALGARAVPRFGNAITIDDRHMDETLHGLIQDVEGGFIQRIAFVAPGRMAWPLPLYELALMTAGRAYDVQTELATTLITAEEAPLAIFGTVASNAVAALLRDANIERINSGYVEIPEPGTVVVNPGDRRLRFDRVIALPELYGPDVRGIPLSEHGFVPVDVHGRVRGAEHVYAAGDATDFPVKHGGIGAQQADAVAQSIAALAGADLTPEPFRPVLRAMLLTDGRPKYLTAQITGGQGFASEITDEPTWSPPSKISAMFLAPYLDALGS